MVAIRHAAWIPDVAPTGAAAAGRRLRVVPLDEHAGQHRQYRRRRLAAVAAAAVALVLVASIVGGLVRSLTDTPALAPTPISQEVHVVQPGDTMWSIAAERTPAGGDIRAVVDRLVDHNGGAALVVGQRISVP